MVSFYNTHIPVQVSVEPRSDFVSDTRQRATARAGQFAGLEQDIADNPGPVFLAGDFNTSPAMGDLRPLRRLLTDATPALRSVYPVSWELHGLPLWRLDWVFTNQGVRVERYEFSDSQGMSDHQAQRIWVSLS
ncbi:endonuclease/exonuclease/phosphatase family protein [Micromonospora zhanjiangensis]